MLELRSTMTRNEFDEFIKSSRTISESAYLENKALFEEAETQGKIRIRKLSSQITAGSIKYPPSESYHIEPLQKTNP